MESYHKEALKGLLPDAEILYRTPASVTEKDLEGAEIILGNPKPAWVSKCSTLKLLQLQSAGADGYTAEGVLPKGCALCNTTGAFGLAISEHMLAVTLALLKKLPSYYEEQKKHAWTDLGEVHSIWNSRTLVVGLGDIGGEYAAKMHLLGSHVTGIRRTKQEKPDYLEALYQMDALDTELPKADIVATVLPRTAETYKVFNAERFALMKPGALFINVGRGNAVDSMALYDALCSGHLGGASVDVTDPEPLPADHPLWTAPNLILTPHVSGFFHLRETYERIVRIAIENVGHQVKNEPLRNVIDFSTGYRKLP